MRLRKIVGPSIKALGILREENAMFEFVDGSHQRDDVMIDCLASWRLLREGVPRRPPTPSLPGTTMPR